MVMAPVVAAVAVALLLTVVVDGQCSVQEVLTDFCPYRMDFECDAVIIEGCPVNTDCFDCDPCRV